MNQSHHACDILLGHFRAGTTLDTLPDDMRPQTRADGYAIQSHLETDTRRRAGWKIAATSIAGQRHINVDGPIVGRLMADMVHPDGACVPFDHNRMRVAEAEFVFTFARDLDPKATPYSQAEALDAVDSLSLGIEIPDSRFANFVAAGGPQLIADNACANQFVLGPKCLDLWRDLDISQHRVHTDVVGKRQADGIGSNVLGDPRSALTWFVNEVTALGITLRAGEFVTTGTCIIPIEIGSGDQIIADFGVLGTVSCHLS